MKKFVIIFIFFAFSNHSEAQRFLGALAFGGNHTQVDGDEVFGFKKLGFNVGVASFLPITQNWFLSLEVAFSQKGSYEKLPLVANPSNSLPYYNLRLNYVEVPFLMHYEDKKLAMLGAGFSFNRLVGAKEIEWGLPTTTNATNGIYSINDINAIVDIRLRVYKSFRINFRYAYSVSKIRTREYSDFAGNTWTRNQYNSILTFRVVYTFNEKINEEQIE